MIRTVNYTLTRGLPWERLIIIKDRRTHRLLSPTDARAYVRTGTATVAQLTTTITSENGIMLSLTSEETQDLPLGELAYDVLATIHGVQQPVAQGTIGVTALDTVTPLEDTQEMEIRYRQRTDYRRTFTWKDSTGAVIAVQSAYMQAKSSAGATVLDLRWYASAPSENTISALPATQRGYLAPATGGTLEVHISDKHTIAAGTYNFDLLVQDIAGDWDCLAKGALVVEETVSSPPA